MCGRSEERAQHPWLAFRWRDQVEMHRGQTTSRGWHDDNILVLAIFVLAMTLAVIERLAAEGTGVLGGKFWDELTDGLKRADGDDDPAHRVGQRHLGRVPVTAGDEVAAHAHFAELHVGEAHGGPAVPELVWGGLRAQVRHGFGQHL